MAWLACFKSVDFSALDKTKNATLSMANYLGKIRVFVLSSSLHYLRRNSGCGSGLDVRNLVLGACISSKEAHSKLKPLVTIYRCAVWTEGQNEHCHSSHNMDGSHRGGAMLVSMFHSFGVILLSNVAPKPEAVDPPTMAWKADGCQRHEDSHGEMEHTNHEKCHAIMGGLNNCYMILIWC